MNPTTFNTICDEIRERRKLSEGSMIKYKQKILKFHAAINGDEEFTGLEFLHTRQEDLMAAILEESSPSARSSYSCLLGALTNKDKTPIKECYAGVVDQLRINMELKNQEYVDKKIVEPHSPNQIKNWVSVGELKKYQRKVMRTAVDIQKRNQDSDEPITWNMFKTIQKATIVSLYINYRLEKEQYPSWYKAISKELPDISNASHIAPKRLEFGNLFVSYEKPFESTENTLFVGGKLSRHKRLWLCKQKNVKPHWEPINNIMNKAITLQLWAVSNLFFLEKDEKCDSLLVMKSGNKMDKSNLSDWIKKSFQDLGVEMTANTLRHIVAEETGPSEQEKKLLGEQLKAMNHSNEVHDLVYSN